MSKSTHSESSEASGPNGDEKFVPGDSIEQRRDALRRVGRAAAAAGVASPMAALAGDGRKWACNPPKTNKVHATISGCKSVLLSGQAGNQCYGRSCSYYKYPSNIPAGCKTYSTPKKFKDIFVCISGSKDSNGVTYYPSNSSNGCLFHKQIDTLCSRYASSQEAHWAVAYCNSTALWSSSDSMSKFPYSPAQVQTYFTNRDLNAYCFFTDYMEQSTI